MNSQTGDIFISFDEKTMKANFGKPISLQEQMDLGSLPERKKDCGATRKSMQMIGAGNAP